MPDDIIMKNALTILISFLIPFFAMCVHAGDLDFSMTSGKSLQAIVVKTNGWDSASATLQCYERIHPDGSWTKVGGRISVTTGRSGLAWGTGAHPPASATGPVKREGDGKGPAGIFRLSAAFGYANPDVMPWVRLPYRQATPNLLCIDDTSSVYYNRIVDSSQVKSDWKSCENMLRQDKQYRLGIVVDHNGNPVVPGNGSCIFMHIWAEPGAGTSGCTAMPEENLKEILRWLDPGALPILVQLPDTVYSRHRKAWRLP
jgi:L,D-peptidoglycan transpeptidase YkuD (ErfK/YbiS/YcfS/YnhG family)